MADMLSTTRARALVRRLRPSPSLGVALLALFVALGGPAYAARQINGKSIKKASIAGSKLKRDTVTGAQIRESTLGEVPRAKLAGSAANATHAGSADSASRADSAGSAGSAGNASHAENATHADSATTADRLGSLNAADVAKASTVVPFDVRMSNTDPDRVLVQAGPFTVMGACTLSGQQNVDKVYATTSENDGAGERVNIFGDEARDTDFDVGDSFTITQSQESGTPPPPNGPSSASGKLWSRAGVTVTFDVAQGNHLFSANASEQSSCTFAGFAVVSGV